MPVFPLIDTRLYLWDPKHLRYPWLDDNVLLNRAYLLDDYRQATTGLPIEAMVFVQCEADLPTVSCFPPSGQYQARLDVP